MSKKRVILRDIGPYKRLYMDPYNGLAWVEDSSTGKESSAHPWVDASGSVAVMKADGYWGKADIMVKSHGSIYNVSHLAIGNDELTRIAIDACNCPGCVLRKQ